MVRKLLIDRNIIVLEGVAVEKKDFCLAFVLQAAVFVCFKLYKQMLNTNILFYLGHIDHDCGNVYLVLF